MNVFLFGMIVSIFAYLIVGWYAGRKVENIVDYYVAGRNAPTFFVVGTLVASFLSTNAFIGEAGMSYNGHAPPIIIMTAVNSTGYIFGALFFGRFIRRSKAITLPEFFGKRFTSRRMQTLAGVTIIVGLTCYLLAVTWGISLIVNQVTGISYSIAICITWFGYTVFTMYSGSKGVILTDTIMFVLFTSVAVLALYFIVDAGGGWFATVKQLAVYEEKPDIISWHGVVGGDTFLRTPQETIIWALILGVAWGVVVAVSPWQTSRYLMARNEHVVIRSACGSAILMLFLYLVINYGATAINLTNPNIEPAESAILWAAMNMVPPVIGAILVSGILAAGLSSASTFLSLTGFSAANDIVGNYFSPQQKLVTTRLTIVGVGLLVFMFAQTFPPNIFWITYFAGPIFASSWGVVAFMSIWSKQITEPAAFWGMISGFLGNIAMNLLTLNDNVTLPVYLDPILVGSLISLITVLSVMRTGTVTEAQNAYRIHLHITPLKELQSSEIAITMRWPIIMMVFSLVMTILLVYFYAMPYEAASEAQSLKVLQT